MCETKICTKCKLELDVNLFGKRAKSNDGLQFQCKKCKSKSNKIYNEKNPSYFNEWYKKNPEKNSERYKRNYIKNKDILLERGKIYRDENKEKRNETCKRYNKENKEKVKEQVGKWYQKNKVALAKHYKQYRINNKEKVSEGNRRWAKDNKDKCNINTQNRRTRKLLLPSTFTLEEWECCKVYFGNSCAYCGKKLPLEQEHFIPITKGGSYSKQNIICACRSCNASKGNRDFEVWYKKYKFYSKEREDFILEFLELNKEQQLIPAI